MMDWARTLSSETSVTLVRITPDAELKGLLLTKAYAMAASDKVKVKVGAYEDTFEWEEAMQTRMPNLIEKALAHLQPCEGAMARTAQEILLSLSPFVLPEVCAPTRHEPACAVRSGGHPD
jgi:hypothetical protein